MSLTEEVTFGKDGHIEENTLIRKLFLSLVIILVASLFFGLGRLTGGGERAGIRLELDPTLTQNQPANVLQAVGVGKPAPQSLGDAGVIGSSKGTKYHYPHCSGAKRISEANRIVFASPEAAEASGYTLAANCSPK